MISNYTIIDVPFNPINYFAILAEITCYQLVIPCNRGLIPSMQLHYDVIAVHSIKSIISMQSINQSINQSLTVSPRSFNHLIDAN